MILLAACSKEEQPGGAEPSSPSSPVLPEIDTDTDKLIHVRTDVPIKAFYKDVFMDGGIKATSRTTLPACDYLGLSLEYFITASNDYTLDDTLSQNAVFIGSDEDSNGRLLYPDGAPRYRCIFVNGGNATAHGRSLKEEGRENFRTFVRNGGSYVGSCAGAYVAALGSSTEIHKEYIGLWPSVATNCKLSDTYTGHFVDNESPLLKYYDFGGDNYIANVYHNGGCYCAKENLIPGTEVLARYDYDIDPEKHNNMHGMASVWAYKADAGSGRVIMSGSHPEGIKSGERRDMMAGMLRYAMEGVGITSVKGILHNGETWQMNQPSSAKNPKRTRIGDMQCHHFVMWVPAGAKNIKIDLIPADNYDFRLMLAKETFAYPEDAQHQFESKSGKAVTAQFSNLASGQWYICVQCTSTVKTSNYEHGTKYAETKILNGAAYDISLSWD